MPKSMQIVPEVTSPGAQTITFVLAVGTVRLTCRLETTFQKEYQAFNYLRRHRTEFERVARERCARGEIEDNVIYLEML